MTIAPLWLALGPLCAALVALGPVFAVSQDGSGGSGPAAVPVTVAAVELRPVTRSLALTGRVEAVDRVEIRARVDGFLEEVSFADGQDVAEGDLLYRIERGLFEAAVAEAEGALVQAKANRDLADIELGRAQQLLERKVGTVEARDVAKAGAEESAGAVTRAEAALARARINLGYTEIAAPVAGRIGRTALTRGAVVGPDSGVLAIVVSQDPMRVVFPVSAREFLRSGQEKADRSSIRVKLRFLDGTVYGHEGRIDFVDVTVDRTTDTVLARATLANPERQLIDGQLVTVSLEAGAAVEKPVVPQAALIADQGGVYVLSVEEGRAVVRRLRTGGALGADVIVEEGIAAGAQVIVGGLERVRPGAPVLASPAEAAPAAGAQ